MFFSVITKNLNSEILIKNLVTLKRWDKKFEYYGGLLENLNFRGGGLVHKKPIYKGELPKKQGEAWTVCQFNWGLTKKEESGIFEGGVDTQCTL